MPPSQPKVAIFRIGDLARTPFLLRGASPELSLTNRLAREAELRERALAVLPEEFSVFNLVNDLVDRNAIVNEFTFNDGLALFSIGDLDITRTGARTRLACETRLPA
jgi:hypothetical protein